jgi:hypothetical protein
MGTCFGGEAHLVSTKLGTSRERGSCMSCRNFPLRGRKLLARLWFMTVHPPVNRGAQVGTDFLWRQVCMLRVPFLRMVFSTSRFLLLLSTMLLKPCHLLFAFLLFQSYSILSEDSGHFVPPCVTGFQSGAGMGTLYIVLFNNSNGSVVGLLLTAS